MSEPGESTAEQKAAAAAAGSYGGVPVSDQELADVWEVSDAPPDAAGSVSSAVSNTADEAEEQPG